MSRTPKLTNDTIYDILKYVRWANQELRNGRKVSRFTHRLIMNTVRLMERYGINVDRNRVYETNYLSELIRDYLREN